jgi:hypothetical protein
MSDWDYVTIRSHALGQNPVEVVRCAKCVETRVSERETRNARIKALEASGMSVAAIGRKVRLSTQQVRVVLGREPAVDDERDGSNDGPRCRCGLLLPCNSCIGRVDTYARRSSWMVGA